MKIIVILIYFFSINSLSQQLPNKVLIGSWIIKAEIIPDKRFKKGTMETAKSTLRFVDSTHIYRTDYFDNPAYTHSNSDVHLEYTLDTLVNPYLLHMTGVGSDQYKWDEYWLIKVIDINTLKIQGQSLSKPKKWYRETKYNTFLLIRNTD